MILFGESLNVISTVIGKEFKQADPAKRNPEIIQKEVLKQKNWVWIILTSILDPLKSSVLS